MKEQAERVLSQLGVSMATAIELYLKQISLTGGMLFSVSLRRVPSSVCMDDMTAEEISQLGVSMATAIELYLKQISLTGGMLFSVSLRRVPSSVCMDDMTAEEMHIRNWKKATMI